MCSVHNQAPVLLRPPPQAVSQEADRAASCRQRTKRVKEEICIGNSRCRPRSYKTTEGEGAMVTRVAKRGGASKPGSPREAGRSRHVDGKGRPRSARSAKRSADHEASARTRSRIMAGVAILTCLLVAAFTIYAMTVSDSELLSEIWSIIKTAVITLLALCRPRLGSSHR